VFLIEIDSNKLLGIPLDSPWQHAAILFLEEKKSPVSEKGIDLGEQKRYFS
jgi:hypothetical protein